MSQSATAFGDGVVVFGDGETVFVVADLLAEFGAGFGLGLAAALRTMRLPAGV